MQEQEYKIFSKRVAVELITKDNELIRTEPNYKHNKYSVFIFRLTDKLLVDLTELSK